MPSRARFLTLQAICLSIALFLTACGGSGSSSGSGTSGGNTSAAGATGGGSTGGSPTPSAVHEWTWVSGSDTTGASAVYGTQGVGAAGNVPGSRGDAVSWTDASGNLWLFGGDDYSGASFNDLWEFNPINKQWTWVRGSSTANATANYGTLGVAASSNEPGARVSAVGWKDASGNLWLFGGAGYDSTGATGLLNDLWEFSPATKEWTWVSGSDTVNVAGVYGTKGVAAVGNVPGARGDISDGAAVSWTDKSGNLWLFGGDGVLNDLWEFNPTTKLWTWVSGSSTVGAVGVYGTQGVASASNAPGARGYSVGWTDASGNLWLFGGEVVGGSNGGDFSDVWEFSPATKEWTWVSGSNTGGAVPVYGTQGAASASNTPGGRDSAVSWTDGSGHFWLFGGLDLSSTQSSATNKFMNDLWEFDPSTKQWTWMSGSNTGNAMGVYGTLGVAAGSNVPGARGPQGIPVSWTDTSGNLWLFGGQGNASTGATGDLNDLWEYQP